MDYDYSHAYYGLGHDIAIWRLLTFKRGQNVTVTETWNIMNFLFVFVLTKVLK